MLHTPYVTHHTPYASAIHHTPYAYAIDHRPYTIHHTPYSVLHSPYTPQSIHRWFRFVSILTPTTPFLNQPSAKVTNSKDTDFAIHYGYGDYVTVGANRWYDDWLNIISLFRYTRLVDEQARRIITYFITYNAEVGARVYTSTAFSFSRSTGGAFKVSRLLIEVVLWIQGEQAINVDGRTILGARARGAH
jgi:hypothetical protein